MFALVALLLTAEPVADAPYAGWTREQLQAERDRVDAARPSLKLPIALFAAGGGGVVIPGVVLAIGGAYVWLLNNSSFFGGGAYYRIDTPYLIGFGAVMTLGVAAIITAIIVMVPTAAKRRESDPELNRLDEAINQLEQREQPPVEATPGEVPPPPLPPPPPPSQVQPGA